VFQRRQIEPQSEPIRRRYLKPRRRRRHHGDVVRTRGVRHERDQAVSVCRTVSGNAAGRIPATLLVPQEDVVQPVVAREPQEHAVSVERGAQFVEQRGKLYRPAARHRHAPWHRCEAELHGEATRPVWARERFGKKRIVMHDERALVELQRVQQLLRLIECQNANVVTNEHHVGEGARRQANGPADKIVPVVHCAVPCADDHGL
jgi:hypothetical protein